MAETQQPKSYIRYEIKTGRIWANITIVPGTEESYKSPGDDLLEGTANYRTEYVTPAKTVAARVAVNIAGPTMVEVGTTVAITGVPVDGWVRTPDMAVVKGLTTYTVSAIDAEFTMVGKYIGGCTVEVMKLGQSQADLIQKVKDECERRTMLIYTTNRGKMKKYSKKESEVDAWDRLGASTVNSVLLGLFNQLPGPVQKLRFRYAIMDAAARGDTVADAIARFRKGISVTEFDVARLEAIEQKHIALIKAAPTSSAKIAAFKAIDWDWAPPVV